MVTELPDGTDTTPEYGLPYALGTLKARDLAQLTQASAEIFEQFLVDLPGDDRTIAARDAALTAQHAAEVQVPLVTAAGAVQVAAARAAADDARGSADVFEAPASQVIADMVDSPTANPAKTAMFGAFAGRGPTTGAAITYKREQLSRFFDRLNDSFVRQLAILAPGDSHFQGNDASDGTDMSSDIPYRTLGLLGSLRTLFGNRTGMPTGEGAMQLRDSRWVRSASGIQEVGITGPGGLGWRISAGGTATLQVAAGNPLVLLHGWWESDAKTAPAKVSVNGAAATVPSGIDLTGLGQLKTPYTIPITGPGDVGYTIVISGPATKYWDLSYGTVLAQGDYGVRVDRMALGGGRMDSYFSRGIAPEFRSILFDTTLASNAKSLVAGGMAAASANDLVMCDFQTNHVSSTGQTGFGNAYDTYTPALHKSYHTDVAQYVTETCGSSYLICVPPPWPLASVGPIPEAQFTAASYEVADANPNVAVFDVSKHPLFATHAIAEARGLANSTGHMKRKGHLLYARLLYQALTAGIA